MTELSEVEAERLSLIRYQLLAAREAVSAPPPINSLAINLMQDVVESALGVAGDHVRAEVKHRDFDKLFDAVVNKVGGSSDLAGLRAAAIALNNARVGFKHHGNQVRDETLRRHLDVAVTLVNTLVEQAFGILLDDVSMLLFIRDERVRGLVQGARKVADGGDLIEGLFRLRLAFDYAIKEYESRKTLDGWHSIFDTKPSFYPSHFDFERMLPGDGASHLRKMAEWTSSLADIVKLGAMGVNLQRYAYFDGVAPAAQYYVSDNATEPHVRFEPVTAQHFEDSYRFVLDTVVRLAAGDYTLTQSRHGDMYREQLYDPEYGGSAHNGRTSYRAEPDGR